MEKIISAHCDRKELLLLWNFFPITHRSNLRIYNQLIYRSFIKRDYCEGHIETKRIEHVINNLIEGPLIEIYPDSSGKLTNYKRGRKNGYYLTWWSNGVIRELGFYDNNRKVGLWQGWYSNRLPWFSTSFIKDKPHGIYQRYDVEGFLVEEVLYNLGTVLKVEKYFKNV